MEPKPAGEAYGEVIDAIHRFLAAPPEGVSAEIIEAFGLVGDSSFLPPGLFLETVEQAPVAITITDPGARILYANAAFEQLTGYPREEVIGANESILSSKSTPKSVYQAMWRTITEHKVWRGKLVNLRKEGDEYLAELSISPVLNPEGRIAYYLCMHWDITELHELQQRLTFQKGLTEAALNAAPMVVAMIDGEGRVLMDNYAYKALITDFKDTEPARLITDALEKQLGFALREICDREQGFTNVEIRLEPAAGREPRWFACSGVRVASFNGDVSSYFRTEEAERCCLLLLANEVTTSRKRTLEARMNMIRTSMAEQQMNQTMREAISASIFQLQAPLNIIRAALSMSGTDERSGLGSVLQQVQTSGEEALAALHKALPQSALEQRTSVNGNELLHEVLHLATDQMLASGIVVDWRPAPVLPSLNSQPNLLRSLFKYILDNAIQALRLSSSDFRELRIETAAEAGELVVVFTDNGIGLEPCDMLKVFEPFYCGWQQSHGHAGMGLTMAQEIVNGFHGYLEIDRDFVGGCRVTIRIPHETESGGFHEEE